MCADMCEVDLEANSFDAIVCLYAIIHVPVAEQSSLIEKMCRWLKSGGYFLVSVARGNWTGQEQDWLGVEGGDIYWSRADRDTYLDWFSDQGLSVEWERFVPEDDGGHPLLLLRK
jgi:SAM-dependent methyltransferase